MIDFGATLGSSKADDIYERNETFQVQEYAPGYLAIGDDSAGRSIVLDLKTENVLIVDQSSMDPDDMEKIADTIGEWLQSNCRLPLV